VFVNILPVARRTGSSLTIRASRTLLAAALAPDVSAGCRRCVHTTITSIWRNDITRGAKKKKRKREREKVRLALAVYFYSNEKSVSGTHMSRHHLRRQRARAPLKRGKMDQKKERAFFFFAKIVGWANTIAVRQPHKRSTAAAATVGLNA
jgi:hypothetical protein